MQISNLTVQSRREERKEARLAKKASKHESWSRHKVSSLQFLILFDTNNCLFFSSYGLKFEALRNIWIW